MVSGFIVVLIPNMWNNYVAHFHIDLFIGPQPLRRQPGPLAQFVLGGFSGEGDVVLFRDAIYHKYSTKIPKQHTAFGSEWNGERAGRSFNSLRSVFFGVMDFGLVKWAN